MSVHECDGCGAVEHSESFVPPIGWVRRGGRKADGTIGRWLLVLCDECEERAADAQTAAG
jgi:hypothetical protein